MTPNRAPSRRQSIAAAAACLAGTSLCRDAIEPETSMMITTAVVGVPATVVHVPDALTVTMALTSVPPMGRYSFW